jgi:hypothetical protein
MIIYAVAVRSSVFVFLMLVLMDGLYPVKDIKLLDHIARIFHISLEKAELYSHVALIYLPVGVLKMAAFYRKVSSSIMIKIQSKHFQLTVFL